MFRKKIQLPPAATVVGPDTVVDGTIQIGDDVRIDGRLEGSIDSRAHVTIGAGGVVVGDVTAASVTVGGRVEGTVVASDRLHMLAAGCIEGDARYGTLEVERGGAIEGSTRRLVPESVQAPRALPEETLPEETEVAASPPGPSEVDATTETRTSPRPISSAPPAPPPPVQPLRTPQTLPGVAGAGGR